MDYFQEGKNKTEKPFINDLHITYHFYETSPNCSLRSNEILTYFEEGEKQTMQRKKWLGFYSHEITHEEYRTVKGD